MESYYRVQNFTQLVFLSQTHSFLYTTNMQQKSAVEEIRSE